MIDQINWKLIEVEGLTIIISILNNNLVLTWTKTYSLSLKQRSILPGWLPLGEPLTILYLGKLEGVTPSWIVAKLKI